MAGLSGSYLSQLEGSVASAFERTVTLHCESVALETGAERLTYDALNRAANRLAHAILAQCAEREQPVAFVSDGGATPYVCLLAILKAGKTYVALDPALPVAQLQAVCAVAEPGLILTPSRSLALAVQLGGPTRPVVNVDTLDGTQSDANPALAIPPSRLAAIFFTTGSTGQPKGIYYDQRSLLHRIFTTILCTQTRPGVRQALYIQCDNSWSATIVFAALLAGATLCPLNIRTMGVPRMAEWIAGVGITHFPMTCSLFRQWMDVLPDADESRYPALRFVAVGAEPLSRRDVERFKQNFPPTCVLFHSLATSECGRIAYANIRRATPLRGERMSVGHADLDKEILIVGEEGHWAAPGETGEIAVRTRYMMSGYWRNPRLTAAVIRPDPDGSDKRIYFTGDIGRIGDDGQLEVLGRRDFQVKVRGYRVQPAEIEQRLFDLGTISEAVVVALDGADGDKRLVAYLVAEGQTPPSATQLRATLSQTLPDYMIPSAFIFLPTLPLTPGGKVDRRALPQPSRERPQMASSYVAPCTALETQLVRIWEDVLPIAPVGVDDDFFALGGDSMDAARIIAGVLRDLGARLSPRELFDCATVRAMAVALSAVQSWPAADAALEFQRRTPSLTPP
ncbi:MAG: non-ribosomal peptide synthetase [Betaproteobacteria bacterium]